MSQLVLVVALAVFCGASVFAVLKDLTSFTIPNRVGLALVAAFAIAAPAAGLPLEALAMHVAAGALVLIVGFALFAFGLIGGGDAKLAAATALFLGFEFLANYVVLSAVLGGVLTLNILVLRQLPILALPGRLGWVARLQDRSEGVPYGVALGAAGIMTLTATPFWSLAFPG